MATQNELRRKITDEIINALKAGGLPPWRMGWTVHSNGRGLPTNAATGRHYSGVNPLILRLAARRHGFRSRYWATFAQWKGLGGSVMPRPAGVEPGAWGTTCVLYKPITKTEIDERTGEEKERAFPLLRSFVLFNADQVAGAERFQVPDGSIGEGFIDYEPADAALSAYPAEVRYGGDRAYYSINGDYIQMPHRHQFIEPKEFYGTAFHECAHHSERRLDWKGDYAFGEIRAEITSAFVLAELGVPQSEDMTNVHSYLASWLKALQDDVTYIFRASTAASKAADYILSFSRSKQDVEEPAEALAV